VLLIVVFWPNEMDPDSILLPLILDRETPLVFNVKSSGPTVMVLQRAN